MNSDRLLPYWEAVKSAESILQEGEGMMKHLETEDNAEPIAFEYELDNHQQKTILGRGM